MSMLSVVHNEMSKYVKNFNTEIKSIKGELKTTKKDLTAADHKIETLNGTIESSTATLEETKTTMNNSTKYLVNFDRNIRRNNVMLFGLPEDEILTLQENEENKEIAEEDKDKIKMILKSIGYEGSVKSYTRLGTDENRTRPIKIVFDSIDSVKFVLQNSSKLKNNQMKQKIYLKSDKTKSEINEFKRLGERKTELLKTYPTTDTETRVKLEKGVLTLDGVEVDRYKSVQTLF